jgi:hypothetical protein
MASARRNTFSASVASPWACSAWPNTMSVMAVRRQLSRQADRFAVSPLLRQRRDTAHQRQHVLRVGLALRRNDA